MLVRCLVEDGLARRLELPSVVSHHMLFALEYKETAWVGSSACTALEPLFCTGIILKSSKTKKRMSWNG